MADILVLHPDYTESRRLRQLLREAGYRCRAMYSAGEAVSWFNHSHQRAMVILPARMLSALRPYLGGMPALLLADGDKPFFSGLKACVPANASDGELLAAVETLLAQSACMRTFGGIVLNTVTREVTLHGEPMQLTTTESALLEALMDSPDAPVTRDELLSRAWGYSCSGVTRTVDVHVQRLRKKLGKGSIETVYRTGYRLAPVV